MRAQTLKDRPHANIAGNVLHLYLRRIVGWSIQSSMTSQLVADALMMAVWRRGKLQELLHHSDQGCQYTSEHFQKLLTEQCIMCSMSRAGEVCDNSAMESFLSTLKMERVNPRFTGRAAKPRQMCLTSSRPSKTQSVVIQHRVTSVL